MSNRKPLYRLLPSRVWRPDPRYLLLDKTPVVIFNVQMMKFFAAFFYFFFFFRSSHPGIALL